MKKIITLSVLFLLSCSAPVQKVCEPLSFEALTDLTLLEKFFRTSEEDVIRARDVVIRHGLIRNLSHLKKMNSGGTKYYLLERENITEMINAVTAGVYLDYIIINSGGDIIYTKSNNDIFGNNVNTGFNDTPVRKCFYSREGVHFEDVDMLTHSSNVLGLYVSVPVITEGAYQGSLILQIDIAGINRLFDSYTDIISREGTIRVTENRGRILSPYHAFSEIDFECLDRNRSWTTGNSEKHVNYSLFNYKNISWIIAREYL